MGSPTREMALAKMQSETDPNGIAPKEPGAKLDAGKSPVFQGVLSYFAHAIKAVADLSAYGANKYSWKGWEKVPNGFARYSDALARHLLKESTEGLWDMEIIRDPKFPGEVLHATQVAWNALARLELLLRDREIKAMTEAMTAETKQVYKDHPAHRDWSQNHPIMHNQVDKT